MAYTNATFYLDFVNGSDTARAAITPTAYANNGSGLVRVTKTAHGLVTDAVVTISGTTSSVYAGDWKITKVDNDNFDLQGSTYSVNPATKGTVTPFGGMSWTDAWKTISGGATAARIAPGDTIRTAKTADPTSIGNATWTNKSTTVTLASAQTTNIYMDGAWTAANSATATTNTTYYREGSNSSAVTIPATAATSTKYAYYATASTLDLSSYDAITFWLRTSSNINNSNTYVIKLCSDTTGDTAVDEFAVPNISNNNAASFTLTRNGGGSLGSSIKSIALYSGTSAPAASSTTYLDDILACSSTGLNLTSLISKSSAGFSTSEVWHTISSINGTTVILSGSKGYYTTGTTPETVTTYVRPTYKFTMQSTSSGTAQPISDSGTAGNLITFSGGWDTSTTTQNGITWVDGQNGTGVAFGNSSRQNYIRLERFGACRFTDPFMSSTTTSTYYYEVDNCLFTSCTNASFYYTKLTNVILNDISTAVYIGLSSFVDNVRIQNTASTTSTIASTSKIGSLYYYNNSAGITISSSSLSYLDFSDNSDVITNATEALINEAVIKNTTAASNTIVGTGGKTTINKLTSSGNTSTVGNTGTLIVKQTASSPQIIGLPSTTAPITYQTPSTMYSLVGGDANDHRSYWGYGNAISQTTTRHTASGMAWQINVTNTGQTSNLPALYPIAKVAVNASSLVTVKAWVKLSHATDIGAKLLVQANEIPGVTADVTATKTADTNWEELTITFTPTVKGVVQVYLAAYWLANLADESVYVDDITVTQA